MRYVVTCPEFYFAGRTLRAGDSFEHGDTIEMRTNVSLGRIAQHVGHAPPSQKPAPPVVPQAEKPLHLAETESDQVAKVKPEPAPRRRYMRRDMQSDES